MNITINADNFHIAFNHAAPEMTPMARAFIDALISSAMSQDAPSAEPPAFPEVPAVDGRPRADAARPCDQG